MPPPSTTPGAKATAATKLRPIGMVLMAWSVLKLLMTSERFTSISGVTLVTVTSSVFPGFSFTGSRVICPVVRPTLLKRTGEKPAISALTL